MGWAKQMQSPSENTSEDTTSARSRSEEAKPEGHGRERTLSQRRGHATRAPEAALERLAMNTSEDTNAMDTSEALWRLEL